MNNFINAQCVVTFPLIEFSIFRDATMIAIDIIVTLVDALITYVKPRYYTESKKSESLWF